MPRLVVFALTLALSAPAFAFPPVPLAPADPVDSGWGANEITEIRLGWDGTRLEYEVDYLIEDNAVLTLISAGIPGGEDNFSTWNGWGGAFPTNTATSIPVDHMSGFYGCGDLFAYELNDGWSTQLTTGIVTSRSGNTCDGSAGHTHVEVDWDTLCYTTPGHVPPGLTLYVASVLRSIDDSDPGDLAPNSATVWFIDTFYEVQVDADWDGVPDASWSQPGDNRATPDPGDADGDGFPAFDGDCDDGDASAYPGASEVCGDGADNDCNGLTDNADPACGGGDDDDDTVGDDDDTVSDDDDTAGDDDVSDDDDTAGDDDAADDDAADDDAADDDASDDDDVSDDDTWWDDDDTSDDDTAGDDDTTEPDGNTTTGCTCGNPGLPSASALGVVAFLSMGMGWRRRF